MQPIVTVTVCLASWSVSQSVSLSVTIEIRSKTAEPIEMLFELWTQLGPRNHVYDEDADAHMRTFNFEGHSILRDIQF